MTESQTKQIPGKLVVFLFGETGLNLETSQVLEVKTIKSAPSYPDVIPKQKVIKVESLKVEGVAVEFVVKAYLPDVVVVEGSLDVADILSDSTLEFKRSLINECRKFLGQFGCDPLFDEDYSVYCISSYSGDPEECLSLYGDKIAAFLKNETIALDEEEVRSTLSSYLKYGKDDITIVDWDGAFIFDSSGDFASNIELFEIANLQLLKSRILDYDLDERLQKTLGLMSVSKRLSLIRAGEVRKVLREIIEIRTLSILESEAVERNIKLIGDWYSAKLYSLISKKFHLDSWKSEIKEKLDTLEDVYTMATENFSVSYRATIEFIILGGWFVLLLLYIGEFLLLQFFK
ncbi:MAG: hypothetical protein A2010_01640 [Nitrospirae bacterium GWD2_57_9]|nr:MAG: hypothetical protein A2010_01640 [Nitrospirae bacterium GWD2_57_9]OGW51272.1 MAG: hypothetical protein A2078_00940 [Nitrospirae bacterium GWC2_57_9]